MLFSRLNHTALWLALLLVLPTSVQALLPKPDLTAAGAIAALKADDLLTSPQNSPRYSQTYNLGATGLRGWIYLSNGSGNTHGADGTMTGESRQILVTVASTPANAVLAVDDVILGAMTGNSGAVPDFTSDARKAFGAAIGEAEKTGAGTLRIKRWRAGVTTDENISMTIMGDYTATAPYTCSKSTLILANARNKLVGQLIADSNFLTNGWSDAITGLALLAGVQPGDPNYATVQTRLQTYARSLASAGPVDGGLPIWDWAYSGLFLAEYYLATSDVSVLSGIQSYTLKLAVSQSINGTFGHSASVLRPDGSGRRVGIGYGPVNAAGIVANMAIVMGKKALLQGGQAIDPEIDGAIQRGSDFFAFYVNKGPIPYGEHEPFISGHSSNGKDSMCAVFFGLQSSRALETEYYSRMTTASYRGREYGHTGQGFSYLWSAMGANMGGSVAVAEHLKPVRWHLDLSRRTDGSFAYDGAEQYGGGETSNGTYLGDSGYYGMNATACYILTYALPLQRLYITGKRDIPANPPPLNLDAATVAHAVAAGNFKVESPGFTNAQLITSLSDFDPVVRHYAAIELGKIARTVTSPELTTLRAMLTGTDANGRMGACQALGLRQDSAALPIIVTRLDKTTESDLWVRAKAASAIRSYTSATASTHRDTMLTKFTANATNPDVIVWSDPIQMSNNFLSLALFGDAIYGGGNIRDFTLSAPKNLLYPAVQAGLKQPDSYSRSGASRFCFDKLPLADIQALMPDFFKVIEIECLADRMWSADSRSNGIKTLSKYKVSEGIPYALAMLDIPENFGWGSGTTIIAGLNALASYGDAARWTLPTLRGYLGKWSPTSSENTTLVTTINSIENAITAPAQAVGLAVANSQVVATTVTKAITLTGTSPRSAVTFTNVTAPTHGTLTGTVPNLTYTPTPGYTGPDFFTFQVLDNLGASYPSLPGTVSIIVGTAGTGLKAEYFDNMDFTNLKLARTDAQVNFDWGTSSPNVALGADTFSVRWSGLLLVPETGSYRFSTLNSDGVRLYVNGVAGVDDYANQTTNWQDGASVNLTASQMVEIQIDYFENTGSAAAKLKWTGPSFAGTNGVIIDTQWLYDGTGMTRTPYGFAQSRTMRKNQSRAITLVGSAGTQTYSVVTPPAHGTLTGTPPYLTFTPAANYIGLDSFTFKVNNGTSDSAPSTISIEVTPANTFSVNFYSYGGLNTDAQKANVLLPAVLPAGLGDWFTSGWQNVEAPWGGGLQPSRPLTSNSESTATFLFKDCRNGWTYNGARTTLLGDGNGNLMDGHVNSTLDGESNKFDMELTNIPFAKYDVIFYMGANLAQFGDGTGKIVFNGGAERAFKLKSGAFNGTFIEMVNATTPGNYIVFSGVTGSSFTTQIWGTGTNGFNHVGPCGFQVREAVVGDTTTTLVSSPVGTSAYSDAVGFTATVSASAIPEGGTVIFKDGTTVLGTAVLSAGTATLSVGALAVGPRSITATYEGNGSYNASVSAPMTYRVTPKPLTIIGVTVGNKIYDGNATAVLNGGTLSGVFGDETVTVVPGSGTFASVNAGTGAATASGYSLGGANAGNYVLTAQPTVPNATITARTIQLSGTRAYDATTTAMAADLSISNNLDGANLSLTGSTLLAGKDVGAQSILPSTLPAVLVRSATGNTGSNATTTFAVTMGDAPVAGNTMVAVISTRGNSANRVSLITQTGATWTRATQATNTNGTTTEIWYAPNVSVGAGTAVTITQASLRSAVVVMEYSGVLTISPLDPINSATGSSISPVTGTTTTTTQANELWIGGIGFISSTPTLGTILNSFTSVASAQSTNGTAGNNAKVYSLQRTVSASGTASSGGTLSASAQWSSAIATFKTVTPTTLALTGSAAANYSLIGATGSVAIIPKSLSVTNPAIAAKIYDATATAGAVTVGTLSGLLGSETLIATASAANYPSVNIGNYPTTVVSYSLANGTNGGLATNYTLPNSTAAGAVTPKALTLAGTMMVTPKTYDGLTTATLTGATLGAAITAGTGSSIDGKPYIGDELSLTLIGTFDTKDAATGKAVSSTSTLTGTQQDNYTLIQPTGLTGIITPAALTVIADNQSKSYGQTLVFGSVATSFTSSPPQAGEVIESVTLECSGGATAAAVMSYPITPSAATGSTFIASNYAIGYVAGALTVSASTTTITLTTSASPSTYGGAVSLTATLSPAASDGTVQFFDNSVALGSPVQLSGGQAQVVISTLAAGNHSITATFSGSSNLSGSTAMAITQTVDKALVTVTMVPTATDITYGQTLASSDLSGGVSSVPGSFAFTAPATVPTAGTTSHSVAFTPSDSNNYQAATLSVSVNANQKPYAAWASDPAHGLTAGVNDGPSDDPDRDGFSNLLEFVLSGGPMASSQTIQPKLSQSNGNWVFSYHRSHLSESTTTQVVEYGNGLTGWTPLTISEFSAGAVTITPGASSDHVEVSIPPQGANGFARLKVIIAP